MNLFPKALIDGYRKFRNERLPTEQSRYRDLSVRGQSPETMVIGCCDSRVSPEVIFDAGPGELFVMRNIANLVPVYQPDKNAHGVSAALEYAVNVLRVKRHQASRHHDRNGLYSRPRLRCQVEPRLMLFKSRMSLQNASTSRN